MARDRFSGLGRTSLFMVGIIALTKGLGFLREVLLTQKFGASAETDAFYLVFALVVLVASLVMSETPRVLVPRYLQCSTEHGDRAGIALVTGSSVWLLVVTSLAGLAGWYGADGLVALMAPEFESDQALLAARMVRILAAAAPICGLVGTVTSMARARGHFYLVQLSLLGMNVGTIAGLLAWSGSMGVVSAALGMMLGLAGTGAVMLLYLGLQRIRPRFGSGAFTGGGRVLGLVVMLVLINSHGGYLAILVDRFFSALLPEGHFSCMGYAYRLLVVPQQILYGAMAVALLPALADRAAAKDQEEVERMVGRALRMLLLMMGPIICGLAVFGEPTVALAFGRGAFGEEWIALTAGIMLCQVPTMLTEILRQPLATVFFAYGRTAVPVAFGLVRVLLLLAIYPFVWEDWGAYGLALGMGAADIVVVVAMAITCRRMLGLRLRGLLSYSLKLAVVTGAVLAGMYQLWSFLEPILGIDDFVTRALALCIAAVLTGGLVLFGTRLAGLQEGRELVQLVRGVLLRRKG